MFVVAFMAVSATLPHVAKVAEMWSTFRKGRRDFETERRRLENLKLRYEIEAIRKLHNLPELNESVTEPVLVAGELATESTLSDVRPSLSPAPQTTTAPPPLPSQQVARMTSPKPWLWLRALSDRLPTLTSVFLVAIIGLVALLIPTSALVAIVSVILVSIDTPEVSSIVWLSSSAVAFIALTYLIVLLLQQFSRQRRWIEFKAASG